MRGARCGARPYLKQRPLLASRWMPSSSQGRGGGTVWASSLAKTPGADNRGRAQTLLTTGWGRLGTHGHCFSIPAVATARSADAAAAARCHTKPSHQPHSDSPRSHHVPVDQVVKRRIVRSHSHITTAPPTPRAQLISPGGDDEGRRVQPGEQRRRTASPPGASEAFAADVPAFREDFSPPLLVDSRDGGSRMFPPPRIQLSIGHVAQYVLTEPEWHRKRSVATSRGAWLPGAHLYGRGFARRQEKRHERRSCWRMLGERERERERNRERENERERGEREREREGGRVGETIGIQEVQLWQTPAINTLCSWMSRDYPEFGARLGSSLFPHRV